MNIMGGYPSLGLILLFPAAALIVLLQPATGGREHLQQEYFGDNGEMERNGALADGHNAFDAAAGQRRFVGGLRRVFFRQRKEPAGTTSARVRTANCVLPSRTRLVNGLRCCRYIDHFFFSVSYA